MKSVLEYLENTVKINENKIAIIEEEKSCTYKELIEYSKKVGSGLVNYVLPRTPVPILMEKGINCMYAFLGTVYAGCFYVLLNPELPITRLMKILEILDSNVLVTDKQNEELAKNLLSQEELVLTNKPTILDIEELVNNEINLEKLQEVRNGTLDVDPLYANFTSGSTGTPKGVVVGHRSVIDFIDVFTTRFNINENDIIANQAPFDFDVSVKDIYSSLRTGATLLIVPKKLFSAPVKLLDYLCDNKATTLVWAVSALCLVTTFHGLDYKTPETINKILFSGEVMPIKHIRQWIEHLPNATFVNVYGPTEITCNCTYHIVDKNLPYEKQIPVGKAFDNEQVFLLNQENKLVQNPGETGEICVKGSALALGYYNEPEKTNEKFVQNPLNRKYIDLIYRTGDLGFWDENKDLFFCGRKDFQIKHMGHRIELEEIERVMEKVDGVERACCIYYEEKSKIFGFYVGTIEKIEFVNKLKEILPVFMVPNVLIRIEKFPITKNGKIDRKELKAWCEDPKRLKEVER